MSAAKRKNLEAVFQATIELAFAAGNYWQVRKIISKIDNDVQASAIDKAYALSILERIKVDPAVQVIALVGIISFIMASWISVN